MSDQAEDTPEPEAPPAPPPVPMGRCASCRTVMPLADTFERDEGESRVRVHRVGATKNNIVGTRICGPVVRAILFHVWLKHQEGDKPERTIRAILPAGVPPEENPDVLDMWERGVEAQLVDERKERGEVPDAGAPPITVVVERWAYMGLRP